MASIKSNLLIVFGLVLVSLMVTSSLELYAQQDDGNFTLVCSDLNNCYFDGYSRQQGDVVVFHVIGDANETRPVNIQVIPLSVDDTYTVYVKSNSSATPDDYDSIYANQTGVKEYPYCDAESDTFYFSIQYDLVSADNSTIAINLTYADGSCESSSSTSQSSSEGSGSASSSQSSSEGSASSQSSSEGSGSQSSSMESSESSQSSSMESSESSQSSQSSSQSSDSDSSSSESDSDSDTDDEGHHHHHHHHHHHYHGGCPPTRNNGNNGNGNGNHHGG